MRILHIIPYYVQATKTGGPAQQLNRLAIAEQSLGNQITIVSSTGNLDQEININFDENIFETDENGIPTIYFHRKRNFFPSTFYYSSYIYTWLNINIQLFDIVIIHGVWTYFGFIGALVCQKFNIPYLVFLHGCFDPWAFNHHKLKKIPYFLLIEKPNLDKASGIIALSDDEEMQVKKLKINKPIFKARNGLLFPVPKIINTESILQNFLPEIGNRPYVCFISRLHPKKGLEVLINAWSYITEKYPDWLLVIGGPDEEDHLAKLKILVTELKLNKSVIFAGLVQNEFKVALLEKASLFVLPSFSEGVPGTVIEALAYGKPVVITPGCHLPEVGLSKAGLIVEPKSEDLENAIIKLINNQELRLQMGINAKELANSEFDERKVAENLIIFCNNIISAQKKV